MRNFWAYHIYDKRKMAHYFEPIEANLHHFNAAKYVNAIKKCRIWTLESFGMLERKQPPKSVCKKCMKKTKTRP